MRGVGRERGGEVYSCQLPLNDSGPDCNSLRLALLEGMSEGEERVALAACCVLLAAIRSPCVNSELLRQAATATPPFPPLPSSPHLPPHPLLPSSPSTPLLSQGYSFSPLPYSPLETTCAPSSPSAPLLTLTTPPHPPLPYSPTVILSLHFPPRLSKPPVHHRGGMEVGHMTDTCRGVANKNGLSSPSTPIPPFRRACCLCASCERNRFSPTSSAPPDPPPPRRPPERRVESSTAPSQSPPFSLF